MVSIGSKWGVANLMDKVHLAGFMAIVMKHIVNLKYFFDMRSGYYMFQYMMHEFFHIKTIAMLPAGIHLVMEMSFGAYRCVSSTALCG